MSSSTRTFFRMLVSRCAPLGWLITLLIAPQAALAAEPASSSRPPQCAQVSERTCALAQALGRGINMGGMLDSPEEGDWGTRLDPAYVDVVAGHFQTVRIPVRWSNHASPDAAAVIDAIFLKRVTGAVDAFLAKGMHVILNVHNYSQVFGDPVMAKEFTVAPSVVNERLINIWRQLALHYRGYSPRLIFELLNEPHGKLDAAAWNDLAPKLLQAVRASNPDRVVMIGPTSFNGIPALPKLTLPADTNLIVSIHNYDPFFFTHQGLTYLPMPMPRGVKCCNEQQRAQIAQVFKTAKTWSQAQGYPVHLGEFGSYKAADMDSRVNYTRAVRDQVEQLNIPWAYWDFANAFGIYDPKARQWIEPLRAALLD